MSVAALDRVTKRFGHTTALDGVSFTIASGDVIALLGRNGAGKSTALAVLLGLRCPDAGTARLFGVDPRRASARQLVGVALQESAFPATLRVRELVELVRAHYVFPLPVPAVLRRFGLEGLSNRQLGGLSGGERRRVGVALAFAGRPSFVVLDEPTAGLDGAARRSVWAAIRGARRRGRHGRAHDAPPRRSRCARRHGSSSSTGASSSRTGASPRSRRRPASRA